MCCFQISRDEYEQRIFRESRRGKPPQASRRVIIFRVVAVLAGRFFVVAVVLVASSPWAMRVCWPRSSGWIGRITAGSPVTARSPNTSRSRPAPIKR